MQRLFEFSPTISVIVELHYEKCHRLCAACGFFGHGCGICDKRLEAEASLDLSGRDAVESGCASLGLESVSGLQATVATVVGKETV